MSWPVSDRWHPHKSGRLVHRIEVWSDSRLVARDAPFLDGSVSEKWVTGVRSQLSLSVPATRQWERWLALPAVELLPFSGFGYGLEEEVLPLGVFPILGYTRSHPAKAISLSGQDHWQYVQSATFTGPTMSYPGRTRDVAARLVSELGIGAARVHPETDELVRVPRNTISSTAELPSVLWEKSRHDTVVELLTSVGAEGYINRWGQPEFRDRQVVVGRSLIADGREDTTVISHEMVPDWSDVYNAVSVTTSNREVPQFAPVVATVTDETHRAHVSKIGPRTLQYSSPLVLDANQAAIAAQALLLSKSGPVWSVSVQCFPDAARMPGDILTIALPEPYAAIVEEVTHPLGDGPQTVRLWAGGPG